jgi:hypothetical protein
MPAIRGKEKELAAGANGKVADEVPKWVIEAQKGLKIMGSDDGGEEWISLMDLWYKLEASTSFSTVSAL